MVIDASAILAILFSEPGSDELIDCLAYGVARAHDLPLLFRGDDFTRTDIRSAL